MYQGLDQLLSSVLFFWNGNLQLSLVRVWSKRKRIDTKLLPKLTKLLSPKSLAQKSYWGIKKPLLVNFDIQFTINIQKPLFCPCPYNKSLVDLCWSTIPLTLIDGVCSNTTRHYPTKFCNNWTYSSKITPIIINKK